MLPAFVSLLDGHLDEIWLVFIVLSAERDDFLHWLVVPVVKGTKNVWDFALLQHFKVLGFTIELVNFFLVVSNYSFLFDLAKF